MVSAVAAVGDGVAMWTRFGGSLGRGAVDRPPEPEPVVNPALYEHRGGMVRTQAVATATSDS